MTDCVFCRIIEKKIPARIIYEDPDCIAFEDISPQAPVHVLIIPRKHMANTLEMGVEDDALIGRLFRAANKIARDKGIAERGFRMVMNTNPEAGQTVYHLHLHLLGGRRMHWPPG
ncbi:MAG: histidine triad nucleotide-binding protein [Nitrospiraceae bacterium]|nr:histidine triad nucleotide-binding protein [Nitrospiraceae bacterium]